MEQRKLGPYVLEELLGAGGMGEVYRAHDTVRDRRVALKVLPEAFSHDHEYSSRFRREQHIAARLRDPHIIPIHDFGDIDGRLFIDMRMVDGRDLSHLLAEGALPPDRAVHLVDQAAQALDSAHAEGLVHRDIKPSNLLVTPSGFVYVVDFGIARKVGTTRTSLTVTGATVGTLDYMAPERFTTAPLDARADIYSLACLMYECLTAQRPFPGHDLPSLMYAHFYTEPEPPSRHSSDLPGGLDEVVLRGMAKNPDDRYATAGELAAAAHAALGGRALLAASWTPPKPSLATTAADPAAGAAAATVTGPTTGAVVAGAAGAGAAGAEAAAAAAARHREATHREAAPSESADSSRASATTAPAVVDLTDDQETRIGPWPAPSPGGMGLVVAGGAHRTVDPLPTVARVSGGTTAVPTAAAAAAPAAATPAAAAPAASAPATDLPTQAPPSPTSSPVVLPDHGPARGPGYGPAPHQPDQFPPDRYPPSPYQGTPPGQPRYPDDQHQGYRGEQHAHQQPPPGGRPPAPPRRRRRGTLALAVVAACLVVALVAAGAWYLLDPLGRDGGGTSAASAGTSADASAASAAPEQSPTATAPPAASVAIPAIGDTIPVGDTPGFVEVTPNGRFAYIANRDAMVVTVIDTAVDKVTATIKIDAGPPQFISFSPSGRTAYISTYRKTGDSSYDDNDVVFLDTATNKVTAVVPVGQRPFASATNPDGSKLFVPSHDTGRIDVIDTATQSVVGEKPVAPNPHWVAFSKDGKTIYTANHESGVVSVIDAATLSTTKEIPVGKAPHSTAVSPDGTRVSVVNYDSNEVSVIDTSTNEVVATIPVDTKPQDIAYAPDGRYMYTANVDAGTVDVIDTASNTVTASIPVGGDPTSISVLPNGTQAYVTLLDQGLVRILDLSA